MSKIGMDGTAYYAVGTTWTEMTSVRDATLNVERALGDTSTRNSDVKTSKPAMINASADLQLLHDPAAADWIALHAAFVGRTTVKVAFSDGSAAAGQGWAGECYVSTFGREEPMEDTMVNNLTLVPARSSTLPWQTFATAAPTLS